MRKNIKVYKPGDPYTRPEEKILANRGGTIDGEERDIPLGSNFLASDMLFEERLFYREKAFEQIEGQDFGLLDMWTSVLQFGKTDLDGLPIYPSEYYLKQVTSAVDQNIFAINFVVDAFEEMVFNVEDYIRKAGSILELGALEGSTIFPLNVKKAWQSPTALYHEHVSAMYESFTNDYLSNKHSKVLVFEHFVKYFIDFCHNAAEEVPIFFSSFMESIYCPLNINGYTIEIDDAPCDNDQLKFVDFIDTPLFEIYRRFAITHGFMIDKNVPWRLIANFNHPKMKSAAQKEIFLGEDYSLRKMFNIMFKQAASLDIELMKFHMASFYNNYVSFRPIVDVPYEKNCFIAGTTLKKGIARRSPITAFAPDQSLDVQSPYYIKYNDSFWLNFYYQIKLIESKFDMAQVKMNKNMRRFMSNYRLKGLDSTTKMILSDINNYREKQNIKRGTFTDSRPELIIYEELYRGDPPSRELEHDVTSLPETDIYEALGQQGSDTYADTTTPTSPSTSTTTSATTISSTDTSSTTTGTGGTTTTGY